MKKACIYTTGDNYSQIMDNLSMYIDQFEFEQDVEPWMLSYRDYDLYILDMHNCEPPAQRRILDRLPGVIRMHSTKVFGMWTNETWKALDRWAPQCAGLDNVVHCDKPNWVSDLAVALRSADRRVKDALGSSDEREE